MLRSLRDIAATFWFLVFCMGFLNSSSVLGGSSQVTRQRDLRQSEDLYLAPLFTKLALWRWC